MQVRVRGPSQGALLRPSTQWGHGGLQAGLNREHNPESVFPSLAPERPPARWRGVLALAWGGRRPAVQVEASGGCRPVGTHGQQAPWKPPRGRESGRQEGAARLPPASHCCTSSAAWPFPRRLSACPTTPLHPGATPARPLEKASTPRGHPSAPPSLPSAPLSGSFSQSTPFSGSVSPSSQPPPQGAGRE